MRNSVGTGVLVAILLSALPAVAHARPGRRSPVTPYHVRLQVTYKHLGVGGCPVTLLVEGAPPVTGRTDADGWVEYERIAVERFVFVAEAPNYFVRRSTFYNFSHRDLTAEVALKRRIPWRLTGTVRGKTAVLPGALVELRTGADAPASTRTDAAGVFSFTPLFDTECSFACSAGAHHRQTVWMANRDQRDLSADVELRPLSQSAAGPWSHGDPAPVVYVHLERRPEAWDKTHPPPPPTAYSASRGATLLTYMRRCDDTESPAAAPAVAQAWILDTAPRAARILDAWAR